MIARIFWLLFVAAAVQADDLAPPTDREELPVRNETYAKPPAEWQLTTRASQGVTFATPCTARENLIQEKALVVATYACEDGEFLYVVIVSPLDVLSASDRALWPEKFSALQVETMRKRAAERGIESQVQLSHRIVFSGASGVQSRVALGERKVVMRVLANEKAGVCLQVMSRGPAPDEAAGHFFRSLQLN